MDRIKSFFKWLLGNLIKPAWNFAKPYLIQFHHWRKRIWKKYQINKIILLLMLSVALISSSYLFYLAKTADVKTLKSSLATHTVLYDENSQEVGTLLGGKGTYVDLSDISQEVQDAVIATEDKNFYQNKGVEPLGILRAGIKNVFIRHGNRNGGSTITQQLAKNAYLTQEQTWDRKAKELFLALEINKKYKKQEVLAMYLNNAYFGNGVWGIEDAAHKYFGKSAKELGLNEAAILAGMLKGPEIYNPINFPENAKNRRDTVLQVMVDQKKVSQKRADQEARVDLTKLLNDNFQTAKNNYKYPSFFDAVIDEAEQKAGISDKDLLNKGYKIYTTMNERYQKSVQAIYENCDNFPQADDQVYANSATVAIDPATGSVQAIASEVGSIEHHIYRSLNFATQNKRSPGSTIKPLVAYVPAIQKGFKINDSIPDNAECLQKIAKINGFDGAEKVQNYDRNFRDEVHLYHALAQSLNVPAIYLESKVGLENSFEMGKKFGLPLLEQDKYYGLALGGLSQGCTPLTMAQAYSTFGNSGEMVAAHLINKIVDSTGTVVYEAHPDQTTVISKQTAKTMTSMMLGTFSNGTGTTAAPSNGTLAGKTGTTETSFDASKVKDQWVIGYNPDVVITTWLGFDKTNEKHCLLSGSDQCAEIFRQIAEQIIPLTSEQSFDKLYSGVQNAYQIESSTEEADDNSNDDNDDVFSSDKIDKFKKKAHDEIKDKKKDLDRITDKISDTTKKVTEKATDLFGKVKGKITQFFGGEE